MSDSRDGRAWARNAISELTSAVNDAAQMLCIEDDDVAVSYVRNAVGKLAKANEFLMRATIHLGYAMAAAAEKRAQLEAQTEKAG